MDFNEYQDNAKVYARYHKELGPFSVILDMQSNMGKISGKLFNILENNQGTFNDEERARLAISLGDLMFNIANIADDLGITFEEILSLNLKKLELIRENENK